MHRKEKLMTVKIGRRRISQCHNRDKLEFEELALSFI